MVAGFQLKRRSRALRRSRPSSTTILKGMFERSVPKLLETEYLKTQWKVAGSNPNGEPASAPCTKSLVSKLLFPEVQAAPSIQAWRWKDYEQECLSSSSKQNCRRCLCRFPSVSDEMCRNLHSGERGRRNPAMELTQRRDPFRAISSEWLGRKRTITNAPGCHQSWTCSKQSLWPWSYLIRHGRRSQSTFRDRGWHSQSSQRGESILGLYIKAILNLGLKGRGNCHRRCWRRDNRREHLQEELYRKEQRFSRDLGPTMFVASNIPWKFVCKPKIFLTIELGYFQGSLFVNFRATDFLKGSLSYSASQKLIFKKNALEFLSESKFLNEIDHIIECFETTTKPRFRNDQDPQYIKFGSTRDSDSNCGIRFGQLKLAG